VIAFTGFEYRELLRSLRIVLGEWFCLFAIAVFYRDRVPVQYGVGLCDGRPE